MKAASWMNLRRNDIEKVRYETISIRFLGNLHFFNCDDIAEFVSGTRRVYRQTILKAIESLDDFQMRSSIDAVRRLTQDRMLVEHPSWNETLFLLTFKSVVKSGEVALYSHVSAELSAEYKRQRTDSLLLKLENAMDACPVLSLDTTRTLASLESNMSVDAVCQPTPTEHAKHIVVVVARKDPPKRRSEHEKWKIVPKSIHDKAR